MPIKPTYKGTASQPFGAVQAVEETPKASNNDIIVLSAMLVAIGVVFVYAITRDDRNLVYGPLVNVHPDIGADVPQIQNVAHAANLLADRVADGL